MPREKGLEVVVACYGKP